MSGRKTSRRDSTMGVQVGAFEIGKRGASRYDLRDPYHLALTLPWPGFFLAALTVELCVNLLFTLLYLARPGCIANARPGAFADAFFFSVETLATVGYGVMSPATLYGHAVSAVEIACGLTCTAMLTGLMFVRFSKPRPRFLYADKMVVTTHNGRPTLMLRVGNGRITLMTGARARIGVLMSEISAEGQHFRRVHDLALQRHELPIFALTWTLIHIIDEASPLRGYDAEQLRGDDVRLFLGLEARDLALGAIVQDMRSYSHADVVFGSRYADAMSVDEHGRTVADLTRISLLEPEIA